MWHKAFTKFLDTCIKGGFKNVKISESGNLVLTQPNGVWFAFGIWTQWRTKNVYCKLVFLEAKNSLKQTVWNLLLIFLLPKNRFQLTLRTYFIDTLNIIKRLLRKLMVTYGLNPIFFPTKHKIFWTRIPRYLKSGT